MPHKEGEPQHFIKSSLEKSVHRNAKSKALKKKSGKVVKRFSDARDRDNENISY